MSHRGISAVVIAIATMAAIVAPAGAAAQPSASVINGDEAAAGTFPYLAWIYYSDSIDNRVCTGSVVASNVVLTAAHCVLRDDFSATVDPARFAVVTGNVHHLAEPHTASAVSSLAVAPNFRIEPPIRTPLAGDAAVLILAQPTPSPPVRLATSQVWSAGTPALVVGWGETGIPNAGDALRVGKETVQADAYCQTRVSYYNPAALICAQDKLEHRYSGCHGDSGGPLVMTAPGTVDEPLEIGVTSFGASDCSPEAPGFFTRVDTVAAWVAGEIAAHPPTFPPPAPPPGVDLTPREPRPRIAAGKARAKATAALRRGLGARFADRREYKIVCDEINVHKQECRVSWKTVDSRYRGTVTVFGLFVAGKVVWHTPYTVRATTCPPKKPVRSRPACPVRTFHG
jgi:secreted trypsin-like serine protease